MADFKPLKVTSTNKVPERFGTGDTVPVIHGGTGLATITTGALMVGNGTGTPTLVGPGTSGQIVTSNGTTLIMSDPSVSGDITQTNANVATVVPGTPVYEKTTANNVDKAQGNAIGTSWVIGLTIASIAAAASGVVRTAGPLTLTTVQWDAITGLTGGLTVGTRFYLDTATSGKLTTSPTDSAGNFLVFVGHALSTTTMLINPDSPIGL